MAASHGYLESIGMQPVNTVTSTLTSAEEKEFGGTNGSSAPSRAKKTGRGCVSRDESAKNVNQRK